MPQELAPKNTSNAPEPAAAPLQGTQPPVPAQTSDKTPKSDTTPKPDSKTYSEAQLAEMLEKARSDEKSKVFGKLDALKEQNAKALAIAEEAAAQLKQVEADRDALREGRVSELKSVNDELGQLREQNAKLSSTIDSIAEASVQRIYEFEMKAYRAEKISGSGLKLVELVTGSTKEEIDASIQAALTREAELTAEVKEAVRKELATNLPTPISPDGSQGRGPTPVVTAENRRAVVHLKGDEYAKRRQELLIEARNKARM